MAAIQCIQACRRFSNAKKGRKKSINDLGVSVRSVGQTPAQQSPSNLRCAFKAQHSHHSVTLLRSSEYFEKGERWRGAPHLLHSAEPRAAEEALTEALELFSRGALKCDAGQQLTSAQPLDSSGAATASAECTCTGRPEGRPLDSSR